MRMGAARWVQLLAATCGCPLPFAAGCKSCLGAWCTNTACFALLSHPDCVPASHPLSLVQTPEGGSLLALAAAQAAQAARTPVLGEGPAGEEAGGAAQQQQQQQQPPQQQADGEGHGGSEPDLRRLSSEEQRAEDERHAAVYDKLVRTLSRNSMRGRSPAPRPVGAQGEEAGENGSIPSLSRSSSLAGQRGQLRSSSLAAAALQLTRLSSQGEVVSPQSASGAPSPVRLARMSSASGAPSPVPPVLARISSQAGTPATSQPASPLRAAEGQPVLLPSPFGGELPRHLRHVQSMPPHPPAAVAAAAPPQPFDVAAETRSAPHEHELRAALASGSAHVPAELDPYCSRFMSGLVGDQEEAG